MSYDKLEEFPVGEVLIDARKDEHGFVTLRFENGISVIFPPGLAGTGPTTVARQAPTLARISASFEATTKENGGRFPPYLIVSRAWARYLANDVNQTDPEAQKIKVVQIIVDPHEPDFRWAW